jgi:hypothetical protein
LPARPHRRLERLRAPGGDLRSPVHRRQSHRVASLLKRWLTGTLHYGYSVDQLDYYLDEFTFRFNRRNSPSRGLLFYRLLQQAVATDPHPYNDLTIAGGIDHYLWT